MGNLLRLALSRHLDQPSRSCKNVMMITTFFFEELADSDDKNAGTLPSAKMVTITESGEEVVAYPAWTLPLSPGFTMASLCMNLLHLNTSLTVYVQADHLIKWSYACMLSNALPSVVASLALILSVGRCHHNVIRRLFLACGRSFRKQKTRFQ